MDDGSSQWSKTTNRLKYHVLHTQGFSLSDQKILVLALKRNFHLNVNKIEPIIDYTYALIP
jgi:hypothetical protein